MEPTIGMVLTLRGRNNHGRQRIQTYGTRWEILKLSRSVHFDSRLGDWALVFSHDKPDYLCWIFLNADTCFVIEGVE